MMEDKMYCIQIGSDTLNNLNLGQMRSVQCFIEDFLEKENNLSISSKNKISLAPITIDQEVNFQGCEENTTYKYCIKVGNDSLSNFSANELTDLYFTIQPFLIQSAKFNIQSDFSHDPSTNDSKDNKIDIKIEEKILEEEPISSDTDSLSISKHTWLSNQNKIPVTKYFLSTPKGSVRNLSRENLSNIAKKMCHFLDEII